MANRFALERFLFVAGVLHKCTKFAYCAANRDTANG